jgi:hypothetical protein
MRVLVSPQAEVGLGTLATDVADRLAGPGGTVVSLRTAGIGNFSRRLSEAEVALLREAALGERPERWVAAEKPGEGVVGYVCVGRPAAAQEGARAAGAGALIAVTDHAGLTWRSPLTGPNEDSLGPRFPSMTGVYAPELVVARLVGRAVETSENAPGKSIPSEGMIVVPGIVAGVFDDRRLSDYEKEMVRLVECSGVSAELAPVVVVMAHLGLRVAAAVLLHTEGREIPGGGS